jgi:hypothetical protein
MKGLLLYFEDLRYVMGRIYPEKLTWDNVTDYNFDIKPQHPKWVKDAFPLILIYHKDKAGDLRQASSIEVMYQNNQNILTQVVMDADSFGVFYRKNKHKGFSNIVAAVTATKDDMNGNYYDVQPLKKYKNFFEFGNVFNPGDQNLKIACEELEKAYPCDSVGQMKLL